MAEPQARYTAPEAASVQAGWRLERLTPASRLFGANGIRTGPDGRIYVAQVSGSQISAIDVNSGEIETISPMGGDIIGPDDIAFDARGNMYATEFTEGRVSVREPNGQTRVVYGEMPGSNPITIYQGRLFAGECRIGGRIMELDLHGGPPKILLEDVPMPNAMEVGPDGMLYIPIMGANEIWRIHPDGGKPEVVARDLGVPDSVKFDADGFIVSTQVASGQVLRIDPRTGEQTVLADIAPGLDNLTFVDGRLFVSSISGQINEILGEGRVRSLVPDGLQWPLDLAVNEDGSLLVVDGGYVYTLKPGEALRCVGMLFSPGFPGYTRCAVATGPGEYVVTTGNGEVARWWPARQESEVLAEGFDILYGVDVAAGGTVVFAEGETGRLLSVRAGEVETLASDLDQPRGVAVAADDTCLVAEEGAGRVVRVSGGRTETVLDGLDQPQGILVRNDLLYVVDVGAKVLVEYDLAGGQRRNLAENLPVGPPPGVTPKFLHGVPPLTGPMVRYTGIAAGADGTLFLSADAEGSVLALRPD